MLHIAGQFLPLGKVNRLYMSSLLCRPFFHHHFSCMQQHIYLCVARIGGDGKGSSEGSSTDIATVYSKRPCTVFHYFKEPLTGEPAIPAGLSIIIFIIQGTIGIQ